MDKRWRRLNFLSSIDYFSGIFIAFPCDVLWCRARKSLNWSVHMKSNRFQRQFTLHMAIKCVDNVMFLCYREKTKRIHSDDFPVGSYSRIELFSGLRNREQVDFLHENNFFKTLIFRPIRIREKSNSISPIFCHCKRRTSEQWCWQNCFHCQQNVLSLEKRSRRFDFLSSIDYFSGIFISTHSMCFHLKLEDHSMTLFMWNQIRFVHNFNYRWKISVCAKYCFSLIERGKKIHFYEFPVDLFARNQFFWH